MTGEYEQKEVYHYSGNINVDAKFAIAKSRIAIIEHFAVHHRECIALNKNKCIIHRIAKLHHPLLSSEYFLFAA